MINLHLEGLLLNKISEIHQGEQTYIFKREQIGESQYLIFNIVGTDEELKLNIDKISKVINNISYKVDNVIDDLDEFLDNIYRKFDIEFNLI